MCVCVCVCLCCRHSPTIWTWCLVEWVSFHFHLPSSSYESSHSLWDSVDHWVISSLSSYIYGQSVVTCRWCVTDYNSLRSNNCNNCTGNKLQSINPTIGVYQHIRSLSRHDAVIIHRLRIGHTRLTHSYLLLGIDQPESVVFGLSLPTNSQAHPDWMPCIN